MGDPGAVVSVPDLALLVGPHLVQGRLVGQLVLFDGDLRGHPAHRVDPAAMAGLHQELRIGPQEMLGHGQLAAVRQHVIGMVAQAFDEAEDVIPAPAVEPARVLAELIEELVHLEGGGERFDEGRRADRAPQDPERVLGIQKHRVPQARLFAALHLGQIKIRCRALLDEPLGVVEEIQAEIEQARRDRLVVQDHVLFLHVPAARPDDEGREPAVVQAVGLAVRSGVLDGTGDGIPQIDLAIHHLLPGGAGRVLEVGHEGVGAGVEGVDDHLAVHGARDLDAAVDEVRRDGRDLPVAVSDIPGLGQEIG